MTLHAAAALSSLFSRVFVKCGCKNKCETRRCNCVKAKVKCIQYCHSGHLDCCNLPSTVVEQTEVFFVSQNNSTRSKQERGELTPAKSTKKSLISQDEPPPRMRGLRLTNESISSYSSPISKNIKILFQAVKAVKFSSDFSWIPLIAATNTFQFWDSWGIPWLSSRSSQLN